MANSPQSIKRARQTEKRRKHNQGIATKFRTMVKRARANAGNADSATEAFANMQSVADIAARKGIIHPRKAARLKKRINNLIRTGANTGEVEKKQAPVPKRGIPASWRRNKDDSYHEEESLRTGVLAVIHDCVKNGTPQDGTKPQNISDLRKIFGEHIAELKENAKESHLYNWKQPDLELDGQKISIYGDWGVNENRPNFKGFVEAAQKVGYDISHKK